MGYNMDVKLHIRCIGVDGFPTVGAASLEKDSPDLMMSVIVFKNHSYLGPFWDSFFPVVLERSAHGPCMHLGRICIR